MIDQEVATAAIKDAIKNSFTGIFCELLSNLTLTQNMKQHKRLFTVVVFLLVLIAVFQLSGLRAGFNLAYLRQIFLNNEVASLLIFVALFALGNLIQIPGLIFLRQQC